MSFLHTGRFSYGSALPLGRQRRYTVPMLSWSARHKLLYLSVIFLIFAIPAAYFGFKAWYRPPSCFDGIKNQGEYSVDRGGPCKLLDERQLTPYSILWARALPVRQGATNVVAYIENPNGSAGVVSAPYHIRLYDKDNVLVAEEDGTTPILPGTITPIFMGPVDTGYREATRAFVEFTAPLTWERMNTSPVGPIRVNDILATAGDASTGGSKVTANVTNIDPATITNVRLVATVFDSAGNAYVASQTIIPRLDGNGTTVPVTFTWPSTFTKRPARIDVLPVVQPNN